MTGKGLFSPERLVPVENAKRIKVRFNADISEVLPWTFTPQQRHLYVLPGETALAFYRVKNNSDKDIIGIATYNVTPDKASLLFIVLFLFFHLKYLVLKQRQIAPYFAKVECFCFEEQKLLAGEEVDLPLLFFIDKDCTEVGEVNDVVLSYTFFRWVVL